MNTGFRHPDKDRNQKKKQKFIPGKRKLEQLDQDLSLPRKLLWMRRFENEDFPLLKNDDAAVWYR